MTGLHEFLDTGYGPDGDDELRRRIAGGADLRERHGPLQETPLHVAARRRRAAACAILLEHGADVDTTSAAGKTAYAHAVRRGFTDITAVLEEHGASTALSDADRLAVAVGSGRLDDARRMLAETPGLARTGNPEEDRLLADVAGRSDSEPISMLVDAGADLAATGLDGGTPLHIAAWFGQPDNARILIDAGAPLDVFDAMHESSPIGWATHGSRYSGDAENRQDAYVALTRMLLEAGSSLHDPDDPDGDAYRERLLGDASPAVAAVLRQHG